MREDLSNRFPGWTVHKITDENITLEKDGYLFSYIDDVDHYYRCEQSEPGYLQRQIDIRNKANGQRYEYRLGAHLSRNYHYFVATPRPQKNELGEVSP